MALPSLPERQTYLDIATEAALSAGAILRKYYGNLQQIREKATPGDLITEADTTSEAAIIELLQRHLPDVPIHAEEAGQLATNQPSPYLWMIDPLDGTVNYAHGYPMFSVSIALLYADEPLVGVVYNPYRDELFRAAQGLGATLNRQPIQVSKTDQLQNSLLTTGFAYDRRQTKDNNYREFCYLTHQTQGVRRGGSAALDLADVACGRLDGYWERGIQPWDMAAGICILREAGGLVTSYDQTPLDMSSGRLLATNGKIHTPLSVALQEAQGWFQSYYAADS
ncbi:MULTISPECIES: inositol monophosphatase family protein [Cyanophyceae]|uniref:inositol monophosphatase family protein n=1 Tax=Cyanophyceae TaxID=3028117 RepID=UPI00016DC56A|nr:MULTISPECIES: inositol monophosphatase family protein [Cyanophyceae]ACA98629.1 Inositol-1-monophosphatase family protein [Picosynechococcus sp. PCC 7002]SMH40451.1 myo-inositol-1(or 4)-monophosphatase [Picosynechococcus sp. OG1]SMQ78382.1 myo-inositol-1(or 4)-monophosphatase [Synechococcus sp. 7002]